LPRERQSTDDNNPFAPPPEGRPDQPWQPRHPSNDDAPDDSSSSSDRPSDRPSSDRPSGWGSQWSSRQPGRSSGGGFGGRSGGQNGNQGQNGGGQKGKGPDGGPGGMKWDPTDPAQRRARYALLSGMWAFFFALFDFPEIALLLGALALYWAISSLRAKPQRRQADALTATAASPPPPPGPAGPLPSSPSNRPQITAAVSGLVMASIALLIVAASFTAQLVYRDYYTCVNDSLTKSGQLACNDLLPDPLRGVLGVKE